MFLLIDYGSATAKTFLVKDTDHYFINEIPLGFPAFSPIPVLDSLLYVINRVQTLTGIELIKSGKPICPIHVVGEIASIKLKELIAGEIEDPINLLKESDLPIISISRDQALVGQDVFRADIDPGEVGFWLPFQINEIEIANYLANTHLYSQAVPYTPRDLEIEYSVARAKIAHTLEDKVISASEIYVTGTTLTHSPKPQLAFLTILNGSTISQPLKITLDREQFIMLFCLMEKYAPEDYKIIWEKEKSNLSVLGTAFLTGGNSRVDILVEGESSEQQIQLAEQSLVLFPLKPKQQARIKTEKNKEYIVEGGEVGLIFDARRRPLTLPANGKERRDLIRSWNIACNAHGEVSEIWP